MSDLVFSKVITGNIDDFVFRVEAVENGKKETGTAFFVAPYYLLTCSHVVCILKESSWQPRKHVHIFLSPQEKLEVKVIDHWDIPESDLALLEIVDQSRPLSVAPMVIGENPALQETATEQYYFKGFSASGKSDGGFLKFQSEGINESATKEVDQLKHDIKFSGELIKHGTSGSPVIDTTTGQVCAIIYKSRSTSRPAGGFGIPTDNIRTFLNRTLKPIDKEEWMEKYLHAFPTLIKEKNQYLQKYVDRLGEECGFIDEEQAKIEEVYVMLQEREGDPRADSYSLTSEKTPLELTEVLHNFTQVTLVGEPGSGKTVTLKYIATHLCLNFLGKANKLGFKQKYLPLFIEMGKETPRSIEHILQERLQASFPREKRSELLELVSLFLGYQQIYLLIDAYDEVQTLKARNQWSKHIRDFILLYPDIQVVSSVRVANFRQGLKLEIGKTFNILPLNSTLRREFVKKWLKIIDNKSRKIGVDDILSNIQKRSSLQKAIENPLLLKIATKEAVRRGLQIFEDAHTRAALYQLHIDTILENTLTKKFPENDLEASGVKKLFDQYKLVAKEILLQIALKLRNNIAVTDCRKSEILGFEKLEELLDQIKVKTGKRPELASGLQFFRLNMGMLVQKEREKVCPHCKSTSECVRYYFGHLTFQEFFVAVWLKRKWEENKSKAWRFIKKSLHLPEFRESILLFAGLLGEEADDFIKKVHNNNSLYEYFLFRDVALVAQLIEETSRGEKTRKHIESKLLNALPQIIAYNQDEINVEIISDILRLSAFQGFTKSLLDRANLEEKQAVLRELFFNYTFQEKRLLHVFNKQVEEFLHDDNTAVLIVGVKRLIANRINTPQITQELKRKLAQIPDADLATEICKYFTLLNYHDSELDVLLVKSYSILTEEIQRVEVENYFEIPLLQLDPNSIARIQDVIQQFEQKKPVFSIFRNCVRKKSNTNPKKYKPEILSAAAILLDEENLNLSVLALLIVEGAAIVDIPDALKEKLHTLLNTKDQEPIIELLAYRILGRTGEIDSLAREEIQSRWLQTTADPKLIVEALKSWPDSNPEAYTRALPFLIAENDRVRRHAQRYFKGIAKRDLTVLYYIIESLGLDHDYFQYDQEEMPTALKETVSQWNTLEQIQAGLPEIFFSFPPIIFKIIPLLHSDNEAFARKLGLSYFAAYLLGREQEAGNFLKQTSKEVLAANPSAIHQAWELPLLEFCFLAFPLNAKIQYYHNDLLHKLVLLLQSNANSLHYKSKVKALLLSSAPKIDISLPGFRQLLEEVDTPFALEILKVRNQEHEISENIERLLDRGKVGDVLIFFKQSNIAFPNVLKQHLIHIIEQSKIRSYRSFASHLLQSFIHEKAIVLKFLSWGSQRTDPFLRKGIAYKGLIKVNIAQDEEIISHFKKFLTEESMEHLMIAYSYFNKQEVVDAPLAKLALKWLGLLLPAPTIHDEASYLYLSPKVTNKIATSHLNLILIGYLDRDPNFNNHSTLEHLKVRYGHRANYQSTALKQLALRFLDSNQDLLMLEAIQYFIMSQDDGQIVQAKMYRLSASKKWYIRYWVGRYYQTISIWDDTILQNLNTILGIRDRKIKTAVVELLGGLAGTNKDTIVKVLSFLKSAMWTEEKKAAIQFFISHKIKEEEIVNTLKTLQGSLIQRQVQVYLRKLEAGFQEKPLPQQHTKKESTSLGFQHQPRVPDDQDKENALVEPEKKNATLTASGFINLLEQKDEVFLIEIIEKHQKENELKNYQLLAFFEESIRHFKQNLRLKRSTIVIESTDLLLNLLIHFNCKSKRILEYFHGIFRSSTLRFPKPFFTKFLDYYDIYKYPSLVEMRGISQLNLEYQFIFPAYMDKLYTFSLDPKHSFDFDDFVDLAIFERESHIITAIFRYLHKTEYYSKKVGNSILSSQILKVDEVKVNLFLEAFPYLRQLTDFRPEEIKNIAIDHFRITLGSEIFGTTLNYFENETALDPRAITDALENLKLVEQFSLRERLVDLIKSCPLTDDEIFQHILPLSIAIADVVSYKSHLENILSHFISYLDLNKEINFRNFFQFIFTNEEHDIFPLVFPYLVNLEMNSPPIITILLEYLQTEKREVFEFTTNYFLQSNVNDELRDRLVAYLRLEKESVLVPILDYCRALQFWNPDLYPRIKELLYHPSNEVKAAVLNYLSGVSHEDEDMVELAVDLLFNDSAPLRNSAENYLFTWEYRKLAQSNLDLLDKVTKKLVSISGVDNLSPKKRLLYNVWQNISNKKLEIKAFNIPLIKVMVDSIERERTVEDKFFKDFMKEPSVHNDLTQG